MPLTALVRPGREHLADYAAALRRGLEPSSHAGPEAAAAHLAMIEADPEGFLAGFEDPEGRGAPVTLPDGTRVPRLPGFTRWIMADEFCGSMGFRWQPGTPDLPPYVLGHIGYEVVPWRRREGHATRALGLMLREVARLGLPHVELTVDPENRASIRVIEANGGQLVEPFLKPAVHGGKPGLRYRIVLPQTGEGQGASLPP